MNFNSIFKFFLPQDKVFYVLFEKVSDTLEEMSTLLLEGVEETNLDNRKRIFGRIAELEHENDSTTHQIYIELGKNFITPFDREDIHTLASTLDDIADYIYGTSKKLGLYNYKERNSRIIALSEVIYKSTVEIKKAVHELRSMKNTQHIKDACVLINSLENEGDDIYDSTVADLFQNEVDPRRIIILKDLLHSLETAADKCEDVANVLESILIKYA